MIDAISGAWSSLSAAKDIAKGLMDIKEAAAVNTKAVELTSAILDIQDKLFLARTERDTLQARIRELEAKLAEADDWEAQKSQYRLVSIHDGCHVYIENGQEPNRLNPPPYYCPTCFINRQLVTLQSPTRTAIRRHYKCAVCETELVERRE